MCKPTRVFKEAVAALAKETPPHLLCQDPHAWPRSSWDTRLLPAGSCGTGWRRASGEQQRASPSSPHTERRDFWRKGKRRNQEVSQKRCREGQGMVAPMVMDS